MADEKELTELSPMERVKRVAKDIYSRIPEAVAQYQDPLASQSPISKSYSPEGAQMVKDMALGPIADVRDIAKGIYERDPVLAGLGTVGLTGIPAKEIAKGAKAAFKIKRHSPDAYDADDYDLAMDIADKEAASASDLAKKVDMGITRDRELDSILYTPDDKIAGATWRSFDDNNYAFDVAIDPKYQGKGFGGALTDRMIDSYDEFSDIPNASMRIHVTSPVMEGMLTRRGFSVVESTPDGGSKIMAKEGAKEMM
jgi:GNAT superfamily N-acetyltransferase